MTRKTFAMIMIAGLAGLAALATGLRPASGPVNAATKEIAAGPSVETTVIRRTTVVRRHVRDRRRASGSGSGSRAAGVPVVASVRHKSGGRHGGGAQGDDDAPRGSGSTGDAEQPASTPRPTTSPSATGGEHEDEHGEELEHESEHGEDHGDDGEDD